MTELTHSSTHDAVREVAANLPGVAFAIVFGSSARGDTHAASDVDVALAFTNHERPTTRELGGIVSRLEKATGQRVDAVVLEDAAPGLAYRIFRDGQAVLVRDREAFVERKARAILEYLDFQPVERACSEAVLARRAG